MMSFIARAQQLVTVAFGVQDPEFLSFAEDMHPTRGCSEVVLSDRAGRLFSVTAFPSGEICLKDLMEENCDENGDCCENWDAEAEP